MPHETPLTPSRRTFLKSGLVTATSLSLLGTSRAEQRDLNCIFLFLVGGPSQIDTWDPKPMATSDIRGPFRPIRTATPGIHVSECFPKLAARMDRVTLVRSLHHDEAPIHETGHQLIQTGHLCTDDREFPHLGARAARDWVVLNGPIEHTGVSLSHGQGSGFLGESHQPTLMDSPLLSSSDRDRYGDSDFGRRVRHSLDLIERGTRFVCVNQYRELFGKVTWDCHADSGSLPATLDDYRREICPQFDTAYASLIEDLSDRGLLDTTLVVAVGEMGRTPRINPRGGRDHWPGAWTALLAGGGLPGGRVIGSTDAIGSEPKDAPISAAELNTMLAQILRVE